MLDFIRGIILGSIDKLNILLSPFDKFSRHMVVADPAPLKGRADAAWEDIQSNWMHGPDNEFYWSMNPNDMGDMAIWQGFYVAACAFRGDARATYAALSGLEKLQYLGGNSRLCRGAGSIDGQQSIDPSRKYYRDGKYIFTDNCSESTLIGYLFGVWAIAYTEPGLNFMVRIARMTNDLARQIHADGEIMLNQDGTKAKFGNLKPGIFTAPIRISALACLYLMADVLGHYIPTDYRFKLSGKLYLDIVRDHLGALSHPETHFLWVHPWYQDLLSYVVLTIQSTMAPLEERRKFRNSIRNQFMKNKNEGNSLYAYMTLMSLGSIGEEYLVGALKTMLEFNITNDKVSSSHKSGSVKNSSDNNIKKMRWGVGSRRKSYSRQPVPTYKRPPQDIVWQRCPYTLDGSEPDHSYNAMDFVLAYHIGNKLGCII